MQLFTYGSLLKGMSLSQTMEGTKFLGPAYVKADLFFLGFYPGIIPGNQIVFGELYEVPEPVIPKIDEVEDYIELNNEKSLYLRQPIDAYRLIDGSKVQASAYFYNKCSEGMPRIESGDYRIFMGQRQSESAWIVSYGSDMSKDNIFSKLGFVPEQKVGFIDGFEREYNVRTGINGYAFANLSFKGESYRCKSVAWKLSNDQLHKLDNSENVREIYYRVSIPFTTSEGETIIGQTYLANTDRLALNLHPEPNYLNSVEAGKSENNLD
jgi:gamma-glutamylcyclotransferase (GGCT)/AIG2-like uncharacterized protein YtfP